MVVAWRELAPLLEDPGPAASAAAPDPGPPPGWRSRVVQTVRQPRRPWSSPPSRSGPSTPTTNPDSSGFIGSTIELCRLFFLSMIRFVVVKSRQCGMTAPAQRATWHEARIARPIGELVSSRFYESAQFRLSRPAAGEPKPTESPTYTETWIPHMQIHRSVCFRAAGPTRRVGSSRPQ